MDMTTDLEIKVEYDIIPDEPATGFVGGLEVQDVYVVLPSGKEALLSWPTAVELTEKLGLEAKCLEHERNFGGEP